MSAVKNVIKDNYNMMLLKDYLRAKIKDAGFANAEVSKTPTGTRIVLHVTRPGIVIGRKGTGIKELTEKLESDFGMKNPQIAVEEITKPELSPEVMCNRMHLILKEVLHSDEQQCGQFNKLWKEEQWESKLQFQEN